MDERQVIIAADPGVSGAIAVLVDGDLATVWDMPTYTFVIGKSERRRIDPIGLRHSINEALARYLCPIDHCYIVIEQVGPQPKDGSVQAFTFGEAYGILRGIFTALHLPIYYVKPTQWKRDLRLRRGKDASRQRAAEMFPAFAQSFSRVKDDGRAEAALIAVWARTQLTQRGDING